MTAAARPHSRRSPWPAWAEPRETPPSGDPAGRDTRAIETVLVVLVGLVLAAAVVWDVVRQTHVNVRTAADRATWRAYTHRNFKNLDVRTLLRGTTDFVCASTNTQHPAARFCLMLSGPVRANRRTVIEGGYYAEPFRTDSYPYRWGCFGVPAQRHLCGLKSAPPLPRSHKG